MQRQASESFQKRQDSILPKKELSLNTHHAANFLEVRSLNMFKHLGYYYKWDCCGQSRLNSPFCQSGEPKHHKNKYQLNMWPCCLETDRRAPGCVAGPGSAENLAKRRIYIAKSTQQFVDGVNSISEFKTISSLNNNSIIKDSETFELCTQQNNLDAKNVDCLDKNIVDFSMDTNLHLDSKEEVQEEDDILGMSSNEVLLYPEDAAEIRNIIHSSSLLMTSYEKTEEMDISENDQGMNITDSTYDENQMSYDVQHDRWVPRNSEQRENLALYDTLICTECDIITDINNESDLIEADVHNPSSAIARVDSSSEEYQPMIQQNVNIESVMAGTNRSSSPAADNMEQLQLLQSMMIEDIKTPSNDYIGIDRSEVLTENKYPLSAPARNFSIFTNYLRKSYIKSLKWDSCPQSMRDDWHWYTSAYKKHQLDQFEGKYVLIANKMVLEGGTCFDSAAQAAEYLEERDLAAIVIHVGPENKDAAPTSPSYIGRNAAQQLDLLGLRRGATATWDKPMVSM